MSTEESDSEVTPLLLSRAPCDRRPKRSCRQLTMNSTIMLGRELCYGLEASLVVPHLLTLGMPANMYSLVFLVPPMFGFLLQPMMGSASDRCRSPLGRRRPFILALDVTIMVGLVLFLNDDAVVNGLLRDQVDSESATVARLVTSTCGAVLVMFAADSMEGPVRAYLLDTCNVEDQHKGLDLQAAFAGIGGVLAYASGGVDWKNLGVRAGSEDLVRFGICFSLFVVSAILNLLSIPEVPLANSKLNTSEDTAEDSHKEDTNQTTVNQGTANDILEEVSVEMEKSTSLPIATFFKSILKMPGALARLCFTQLIGWLGFMAIMLFFTDFMGRKVYGGDPQAAAGSEARRRYEEGVEMGCWGLTINAAACALFSGLAKCLLSRLRLRTMYMYGILLFALGMGSMVLLVELTAAVGWPFLLLCPVMGLMYSTLSIVPYKLLSRYHCNEQYVTTGTDGVRRRGMGVDCALLTAQIQLGRVIIGAVMGPVVNAAGTLTVVVGMAGSLAVCAFLAAALLVQYDI